MIGLGSNRLTVCRRGGMRVTQAGRGGMEWLAGGRVPDWASPYSAQATAALQAQFPTQWPTIRDYGFAHPEIVGYMNAYAPEDAKIAYSLVEGIGFRRFNTDGLAYIASTFYLQGKDKITTEVWYPSQFVGGTGNQSVWCARDWSDTQIKTYTVFIIGNNPRIDYGNSNMNTVNINIPRQQKVDIVADKGDLYINGTKYVTQSQITFTTGGAVYLYTSYNNNGMPPTNIHNGVGQGKFFVERDGALVFGLCPFIRNNAKGMIDIVSGTFHPNANSSGSFSESIETPAS